MTPQQLLADVTSGKFKPVYYFFGSEDYRIIEAEKFLAAQFLPNLQLTTNYRRLNGKKTSATDIIAELSVYPMLGERQVFSISDFQSFKPKEIERILKVLQPPDPNRVVILTSPSDKAPRKKSAFYGTMSGAAELVEFKKLTPGESAGMIARRLDKHGIKIDKEALGLLVDLIAGNRGALEVETEKLINYRQADEAVTTEDIRKLAAGYEVYSIFELADKIVAGNTRQVLAQVEQVLAEGTSPTGILYHLGTHFLSLYLVKNGKPLDPRRRFLTSRFREQAGKYSNQQLEKMIIQIAETDAELRRTPLKPETLLESLILQLMKAA